MFIGMDIGATRIKGVLVSDTPGFRIEEKISKETKRESKEELLEELKLLYTELGLKTKEPISSLGIGIPGVLDNESSTIIKAPNLPLIEGLKKGDIQDALHIQIFLENDANCFALAEYLYGAGKGSRNMVGITLGSGVGGGVIIGGKLYRGSFGGAGEVGHMIVEARGEECRCGRKGCFEMYASEKFLTRETILDAFALERLLRKGEKEAKRICENFSWWVSLGITNVVNLFDPEVIVIGGGLVSLVDFPLVEGIINYPAPRVEGIPSGKFVFRGLPTPPKQPLGLRRLGIPAASEQGIQPLKIKEQALSSASRTNVKVCKTELGEYAGAIGAASAK